MKTSIQGQIMSVGRRTSGNDLDNVYEIKIKTHQPPAELMDARYNWVKITIETIQDALW